MNSFDGFHFCGMTSGTFRDAKRPDSSTLTCPFGTLPCSPNTSADNTICLAPSEDLVQQDYSENEDCPILDMFVAQDAQDMDIYLQDGEWQLIE